MVYGNASSALFNTVVILAIALFFIIVGSLITSFREE
jgi:surface polysaccharide O-acyltransferase-like enzyme